MINNFSKIPVQSLSSSSSASPESGLGTSHSSLPGSGQGSTNDQHINDEMFYETEPIQPLGTCKALYPFDGKNNNNSEICSKDIPTSIS